MVIVCVMAGCKKEDTAVRVTEPALVTEPITEAPTEMIPPTEPLTEPPTEPDPVEELLDTMTMEEKVGQLFLARCPWENAAEDVAGYHLGG